jgi:hypothetical protein
MHHQAAVNAIISSSANHLDFAAPSFLCRRAERYYSTLHLACLDCMRCTNRSRQAGAGNQVVTTGVANRLESIVSVTRMGAPD